MIRFLVGTNFLILTFDMMNIDILSDGQRSGGQANACIKCVIMTMF